MRRFIGLMLAALALSAPALALDRPTVRTASGPVVGVANDGQVIFKGIPFAAPPVGSLRWKPPQPVIPWSAPRDASRFGAICSQPPRPDGALAMGAGSPSSEDCLFLNIWAPQGAAKAPVMVWIHGGAHRFGAGSGTFYDGAAFARDGVILVSLNYRLGALGYFAHPALTKAAAPDEPLGSYGLMDQMAALRWVQANIAAFGGDPANVTVFGESAGGASILALLATPSAKGLFAKAIVESGGGWEAPKSLAQAEQAGAALASKAGLNGASASLAELRALSPEQLYDVGGGLGAVGAFPDGRLLKQNATQAFVRGEALDVPLLIGSNSNEASLMRAFGIPPQGIIGRLGPAQKAAYAGLSDQEMAEAAFGDFVMGAPARWVAAQASGGAPAFLYHFSYVPTLRRGSVSGAPHGGEIPYVFETGSKVLARFASPEDHAMEVRMHACWVAFARTGQPTCDGAEAWPAYTPADDRLMEFGVSSGVRQGFRKAEWDATQKLMPF